MATVSTLQHKAQLRRDEGPGGIISAGLPLRRKQLLLARAIGDTVLPQRIWLGCGENRLGIDAGWRRIYGITLQIPGNAEVNLHLDQIDAAGREAVAARLNSCIRQFLARDHDLTQRFELLDGNFGQDEGLPAAIVLEPDQPTPVADPVPAVSAIPVSEAPVTHTTVTEAPVGTAPATEAPHTEIHTRSDPMAPTSMAEVISGLQTQLGHDLLMVWLPASEDPGPAEALSATEEGIALREFRPQELGLLIREWAKG